MIRRIVRLTFRINRFEVGAVVILGGLLVLGSIIVNWALSWLALPPECAVVFDTGELTEPCAAKFETFQKILAVATPITLLMSLFPIIGGLLVGGPVIAREIERGTTSLAWSMSPSRLLWFLHRVVPMVILLLVVSYIVGVAADHLMRPLMPQANLDQSFAGFRFRGMLLATQAFLLASTAVAIGSMLGRAVPTFLLSLILGTLSLVAVAAVHREVLLSEAAIVAQDENFIFSNNDLTLDYKFQMPDGALVSYEQMIAIDPAAFDPDTGAARYPNVLLLVPGERYRAVEAREAAAELVIGLVFLAAGAFVITRRRPT